MDGPVVLMMAAGPGAIGRSNTRVPGAGAAASGSGALAAPVLGALGAMPSDASAGDRGALLSTLCAGTTPGCSVRELRVRVATRDAAKR